MCKYMGSWGWSAHANMCSDIHPLDFYFSVKNKSPEIIFPVEMVHITANKIFHYIHQGPLHGKEGPGKIIISLG